MDERLQTLAKIYEEKMKAYYETSLGIKKGIPKAICNLSYQKPCKLCQLNSEITRKIKANLLPSEMSDILFRLTRRFYSNVVTVNEPSKVVIFEYGFSILKNLVTLHMDPLSDYKDWLSPETGRDIIIRKILGSSKRNTTYQVIPRATSSRLVDPSVLTKLFPLDKLLENLSAWSSYILRLGSLPVGSTEIRFLPSWLGKEYANVFFVEIDYHFGISQEEYNDVNNGILNPYESYLKESKEFPKESKIEMRNEPESVTPSCFGTFLNNEKCEPCKEKGIYKACELFSMK